jgi:ParB-like chromosome segregation protein Spo0J
MGASSNNDTPTGPDVLALYERAVRLIDSGHSSGVYEDFRIFMVEARDYKFARLTRKKGVDHDDGEADHRAEDTHLKAAIEVYPQALAAVQRGEAAARAAAQVPDAQSAVNDEAGSTRQAPPAGEPVARDAATSNANPPGDIEDEGAALDEEPVNANDIAECSESDVKTADWLRTHQIRAPEDRARLGWGDVGDRAAIEVSLSTTPTGQEVLALLERVEKVVHNRRHAGASSNLDPFFFKATDYKSTRGKPNKSEHLQAAVPLYAAALAAVEEAEATDRAVRAARAAQKVAAQSAAKVPAAGEPVDHDAATPNANPPVEVRRVRLEEVVVPKERMRELGDITQLVDSIHELGLLEPIIVRRDTGTLISGLHRLEAVRANGEDTILARLVDVTDLHAEMMEIDENLVRVELTVLERAEHLRRRKELYEALHPEVKHGGAPGKAGGGKDKAKGARVASFAADTAKKTGLSERTVQEDVQVAKLSPEVKLLVKGTPLANRKRDLVTLSRLPKEKQAAAVRAVTAGEARTVVEAALKSPDEPKTNKPGLATGKAGVAARRPAKVALDAATSTAPRTCVNCGTQLDAVLTVRDTLRSLASGETIKVPLDLEQTHQVKAVHDVIIGVRAVINELKALPLEMREERSELVQEAVDVITKGLRALDAVLDPILNRRRARTAA